MEPSPIPNDRKGQVGIGTLIVFIAMVLVAAIAAGVLINTAGFLQSQSEQTGQESSAQVSDRLQVVNTVGDHVADNDGDQNAEVEVLNMTVKKAPGADDIDLESVTMQFITEGQVVDLVHAESSEQDPGYNFMTSTVQDQNDNSIANSKVLNDPADRARITLDLGDQTSGHDMVSSVNSGEISPPLNEGEEADIQLNTQAGGETTVTIRVPDSLSDKTAVQL